MKRLVNLTAWAALSSALFINPVAQACDGHEGKGGPLSRMDANGDGKVTQQEMLAAATARFDAADTNKDGTVTPVEREAAHGAKMRHRQKGDHMGKGHNAPKTKADLTAKVAERFKRLDQNGDGVLSGDELARGKQHAGGGPDADGEEADG